MRPCVSEEINCLEDPIHMHTVGAYMHTAQQG